MTRYRASAGLLLGLALVLAQVGQPQTGPHDACRTMRTNPNGVAGGEILVGTGPEIILSADSTRCRAVITNMSASMALRCRSLAEAAPTGTTGLWIAPRGVRKFGLSAQKGLQCVRDSGGGDGVPVSVEEYFP